MNLSNTPLTVAELRSLLDSYRPNEIVLMWNHVLDQPMPIVDACYHADGVMLNTAWRDKDRPAVLAEMREAIDYAGLEGEWDAIKARQTADADDDIEFCRKCRDAFEPRADGRDDGLCVYCDHRTDEEVL